MEKLEQTAPHPKEFIRRGFLFALGAILLLLIAYLIWGVGIAVGGVITPFILGIGVALLLDPIVRRLKRRGLSRPAAAAAVFVIFLIAVIGIGYWGVPVIIQQATSLAQNAPAKVAGLGKTVDDWLTLHKHKLGPIKLPQSSQLLIQQLSTKISDAVTQSAGSIVTILGNAASVVIQIVVVLIVGYFVLSDYDRLRARAFFFVPTSQRKTVGHVVADVGEVFSDYLRGLLVVCVMYGLGLTLLLYCLAIGHHQLADYALLIGAVAGVLYAVPYLGAIITALMVFIVGFSAGGLHFGIIAVALTVGLNQVFDNIITPRVVGGGVGLHPVVALFALALGAEMFKIWGMLLAVPVAASVQVILYRLYPKLRAPTPKEFLDAEGVPLDESEGPKIGGEQPLGPTPDIPSAAKVGADNA